MRPLLLLVLLAAVGGSHVRGQEVSAALGRLHVIGAREATYTWQFQYLHPLAGAWSASFTWLNEGHLDGHHRDGASVQVWRFHRMERNSLRLGAGLGIYRNFDTTPGQDGGGYQNDHGLRTLLSLRAQYPFAGGAWEGFVQLNRVLGAPGPQTQGSLVGVSTRFGGHPSVRPSASPAPREDPANELVFLFGRTILNSMESETTEFLQSFAVEYRRRLARNVDVSVTYCDEGGIDAARRDGLSVQAWLSTRSANRDWMLSVGIGPYLSRTFPDRGKSEPPDTVNIRSSGRISMLAGRSLGPHLGLRLQWNRTITLNDRDTDVLLTGLAYSW
ncbi:hypothetical protein [Geothrix sp. 21YS21S-2]|uniref:hypothetical protein n=1 Tax=Geothrix sp. 21YS21S-2 TaxID=3068893 RepID=UPI0027B9CC55|nr:hypothetical protein [Geothrix sp. 21YS21S-2]